MFPRSMEWWEASSTSAGTRESCRADGSIDVLAGSVAGSSTGGTGGSDDEGIGSPASLVAGGVAFSPSTVPCFTSVAVCANSSASGAAWSTVGVIAGVETSSDIFVSGLTVWCDAHCDAPAQTRLAISAPQHTARPVVTLRDTGRTAAPPSPSTSFAAASRVLTSTVRRLCA